MQAAWGYETARGPRAGLTAQTCRRGLSLLEVLLALALLGMSLALVSELVRLGSRCATTAQDLSRAQLIAESVMAEVTTGILPAEAVNQATVEHDPDWLYSITLERAEQPNLVSVVVVVEPAESAAMYPTTFTLTRWMADPGVELPEKAEKDDGVSSSTTESSAN